MGDREIAPLVFAEPLLRKFIWCIPAFYKHGNALRTDHVEAFVRTRLQAAQIPFIAELRHAPFQSFIRPPGERGQMVERRDAELIDVVYDFHISLVELKAGAWHGS